jgi:hypothetical protein
VDRVVGAKPRPRILFLGFAAGDARLDELTALAPTTDARAERDLTGVRQEEWDAILCNGNPHPLGLAPHLQILAFGSSQGQPRWPITTVSNDAGTVCELAWMTSSFSTEFVIPPALPSSLVPLVEELLELARSRSANDYLVAYVRSSRGSFAGDDPVVDPLLMDPDGKVLAARVKRFPDQLSEVWALPSDADVVSWTRAALKNWELLDPQRFPKVEPWREYPEWLTPAELTLMAEHDENQRLAEEAAARHRARADVIEAERQAARVATDQLERQLLVGQGDALVDAVAAALRAFGFSVRDMDDEAGDNPKLEDLRVSDGDEWEAIVEVRGYARGAQLGDITRIERFIRRYVQESQREPDAAWYIVNHFAADDPGTRPAPLANHPGEIADFAEDSNGLVLDTRDLFRMWVDVQSGALSADEARARLRRARGFYAG